MFYSCQPRTDSPRLDRGAHLPAVRGGDPAGSAGRRVRGGQRPICTAHRCRCISLALHAPYLLFGMDVLSGAVSDRGYPRPAGGVGERKHPEYKYSEFKGTTRKLLIGVVSYAVSHAFWQRNEAGLPVLCLFPKMEFLVFVDISPIQTSLNPQKLQI